MTQSAHIVLFSIGVLAAIGISAARAADEVPCAPVRLVYIPPAALAELKRTDPCFAAALAGGEASAPNPHVRATLAAPVHQAVTAPALRTTTTAEGASRHGLIQQREAPRAAEGTDFRNVRILNAGESETALYRHER
jgi:hypothetical protein